MLREYVCHPCAGTILIYEFKMNLFDASVPIPTDSRGSQQSGALDENSKKRICSTFGVSIPFANVLPWAHIHLYPGWCIVKSDQPNSTEILSCSCAFTWQLHWKCIYKNKFHNWLDTVCNMIKFGLKELPLKHFWAKSNCFVSFTLGNILVIILWLFFIPSWSMALKDIPRRDVHFSLSQSV